MRQFLFFTYGEPGWRGVQVRGLRVASYFSKDDVLFWNGGDSQFIRDHGFTVAQINLSLISPDDIAIPEGIKVVIFCDLPTNELFQFSLFIAAKKKGIPIVVLEQMYRRGQTKEYVYKTIIEESSLVIFNGLVFQKDEQAPGVSIVPPLVEFQVEDNTKEMLAQKWQIDPNCPWFFGVAYKKDILEKITELGTALKKEGYVFHFVASSEVKKRQEIEGSNVTVLPFALGDDFYRFIKASELVFTKLGFLQILEVIALGKPIVVLGGGGYVLQGKDVIDSKIREVLFFAEQLSEAVNISKQFLSDQTYRKEINDKVLRLHDGTLYGGKMSADLIKRLLTKNPKIFHAHPKTLVILVNDEILSYRDVIDRMPGTYIMTLVMSAPTDQFIVKQPNEKFLSTRLNEVLPNQTNEILPHFFGELFLFSKRKYDGLLHMLPWYDQWVEELKKRFKDAERIVMSRKMKAIIKNLIPSDCIEKIEILPEGE